MPQASPARWLMPMLLALTTSACSPAPPTERSGSRAIDLSATRNTRLGRAIAPLVESHPGKAGVRLIADPLDAFATWMRLVGKSERSLDLQYYIWDDDVSGTLMLAALREAADRGVRVRLLLDDLGTTGMDAELAALDRLPNAEVRLFNPLALRGGLKWLSYLGDFARANRRMHDKVLIADNQAAIIGGRNIDDTYFGASRERLFLDLDVLVTGRVVRQASARFDRFWASPSAWPVAGVVSDVHAGPEAFVTDAPQAARFREALKRVDLDDVLTGPDASMVWAPVTLVGDEPEKGLGIPPANEDLLTGQLREILETPARSIDVISSFFVPTPTVTEALTSLAARGVRVRVLTNSLDASDMPPAHAGYARYRRPLLAGGVQLYEMRRLTAGDVVDEPNGSLARSSTTLHAKAVVIDGETVFLGSYNVDPRSALLNTELGLVIESRALAGRVEAMFDEQLPHGVYELRLEDGKIRWLERSAEGRTIRHDREPGAGPLKRGAVWFFSLLPIEWLL
jgi:putative cardiolipin synthase